MLLSSRLLPAQRLRRLRPWGGLLLLMLLAWLAAGRWLQLERAALHERESERLQAQVIALDAIISPQLINIDAVLKAMAPLDRKQVNGPLLHTLANAMPVVQVLNVTDAQGHVQLSSAADQLGQDVSQQAWFQLPQAQLGRHLLHLSLPLQTASGAFVLSLSRARVDAQGRFAGVVSASLDPRYFALVLQAAQPTADTWSALVHEDGDLLGLTPPDAAWTGRNLLAAPASILALHLASGRQTGLYLRPSVLSGDLRRSAVRTLRPSGLPTDKALVLAVARSVNSLEAPWRQQLYAVLLIGVAMSLAGVAALLLWQRRQRQMAMLQRRQRRLERDAAERMALALEGAALGLWDWDVVSGTVCFDARWCAMLGYRVQDLAPHVSSWRDLLHPDDRAAVTAQLQPYLDGRAEHFTLQFRLRHRDGHWVWIHSNGRMMGRDAEGRVLRMVGTHLDISQIRSSEQQLQSQAEHTQAILDNMVDGVITIDEQGRIESINLSACRMFGYADAELLGRNVRVLMPEPDRGRHDQYLANHMRGGPARIIGIGRDVSGQRKDGAVFPMSLAVSRIERDGRPLFIGLTRDITERKRAEAAIEQLAFYDPLTSLPNRRLLLDRLNQALAASRRSGRHGAVLFIDMDNFKSLNDTLGHGMGDRMLQRVAQRLQGALRAGDTVARWGGDEFVVLMQDLGGKRADAIRHAEQAGEKLLRVLGQPYKLDDYAHHSTPSIGIVLWCDEQTDSEELLKHADHAMYQAKAGGRNQLSFFDPAAQAAMAERAALEVELRRAIDEQRFELHFQAQVGRDGQLLGAETLLRWWHPERGWISPAHFIPLAEQTGLIVPLGERVLARSCAQLARWAAEPKLAALKLAVNVSALQFRQKDFLGLMRNLLVRSGAPIGRLKIELTESAVLDDVEAVIALMSELSALGLSFSLDDFGTGYSSLAYLKRLPLKQLKIDQSFVRDLLTEPNARAIARAIIQLGDSLGLEVMAEGVETEAQRELLASQGCHAVQGYLFSRPLPLAEFEALVRAWPARTALTPDALSVINIIRRSMPMPQPPAGGMPYSSARMKSAS
ncbi:MAG: EAL domain-containing protein [Paucibacter sp.]|nr:EAL domain-containing protein [Roseateles sp.]